MPKEMTWRKAIEKVLSEASGAVQYNDITQKIIQDSLRTDLGATPAATVSAYLATAIKREGPDCPFQRVGRGLYIWKAKAGNALLPDQQLAELDEQEDKEAQYDIITSFGMFWLRDAIEWAQPPKILGVQQMGAKPVDFCKQMGIYLLYDVREVIYVGRTERPLGRRLLEHTVDRLAYRWDRFSWFGLLPVLETGELAEMPKTYDAVKIIPAIEALMIEALEPRQNRKRGDDLSAVEYNQIEDPEKQKRKAKKIVEDVLNKR
jgi:hypothetical protein